MTEPRTPGVSVGERVRESGGGVGEGAVARGRALRGSRAGRASRRRRLWRVMRIGVPVAVLLTLLATVALRTPSPVGHWDGAEGRDRFLAAYDAAFADMPAVDEVIDVRTDFGVVRLYRFNGSGDAGAPLVLLPGRSSASPVWADNMPALLAIGDVYAIDLLGEPGRSVQERPIENDEEQAEWLHQTLQGLPEERFHLIGLSIGGWNAVNLGLHRPGSLASMTLIDPVFVFADMPLGTMVRALPASVPWLPKSWRDGFNSYTAGGAEVEDVPVADMIEAGMRHYSLKLPQPTRVAEDLLGALEMPVLAILAGGSVMHDAGRAAEVAARALPEATVHLYPGASHAVNGEQPERLAEDIAAFLRAPR